MRKRKKRLEVRRKGGAPQRIRRTKEYQDYLASEAWKLLRKRLFAVRWQACERCQGTTWLEVHHRTYKRLGKERLEDLEILCRVCHLAHHAAKKTAGTTPAKRKGWQWQEAAAVKLAEPRAWDLRDRLVAQFTRSA